MGMMLDEWLCWPPGSKIELLDGRLIVSDRLEHSRLLLNHFLRGWGLAAALPFAPLPLWWDALSIEFGLPKSVVGSPSEAIAWADSVSHRVEKTLPHQGSWRWTYSQLRQDLRMAMYGLERNNKGLGRCSGSGVVNRLGNDGFMPDVYFYRGTPNNKQYDYFLEGPAEIVVELLQPGCEHYGKKTKRDRYQAAGISELWLIDPAKKEIALLQLHSESYQQQHPDASGRYRVSSIDGLTFFPEKLWAEETRRTHPLEDFLFEVNGNTQLLEEFIASMGEGIEITRGLTKLQAQIEPDEITFEDYIYWCPEAKFEFVDGRPWLGGYKGAKGLIGMLLKTFGLREAVRLAHPSEWVAALVAAQAEDVSQARKQAWWAIAEQTAQFLKDQFDIHRVAIAGDLARNEPLDFWSKLTLVVWGVPVSETAYTDIQQVVSQLNREPEIQLIVADSNLSETEEKLLEAELIDVR